MASTRPTTTSIAAVGRFAAYPATPSSPSRPLHHPAHRNFHHPGSDRADRSGVREKGTRKFQTVWSVAHLEFLVRAEGEDGESVDNLLLERWLLLVGGREGRLLAGPRGSRWPGRSRVAVPWVTGLGAESEAAAAAATSAATAATATSTSTTATAAAAAVTDATAAGGVLVLAAVAVLLVVGRPLPRLLGLLLLLLLLLRGGQALPLRQHALRPLPSSILLAALLRLDLHLRAISATRRVAT